MSLVSMEDVERLERRATAAIAEKSGSDSVRIALDQLRADRTNGEPLDTAFHWLRAALDEVRLRSAGKEQQP